MPNLRRSVYAKQVVNFRCLIDQKRFYWRGQRVSARQLDSIAYDQYDATQVIHSRYSAWERVA